VTAIASPPGSEGEVSVTTTSAAGCLLEVSIATPEMVEKPLVAGPVGAAGSSGASSMSAAAALPLSSATSFSACLNADFLKRTR
jgi:hypothetical protein